jgi:tetratricopeptide (TPR) repeat protein
MTVHLYAGRWSELERLAAELLEDNEDRAGVEDVYYRLAILHALRGERDAAQASLERIAPWERTDEVEAKVLHQSAVVSVRLGQGHAEEALDHGRRMMGDAIQALGASNEAVRYAWPDTLQAALALERHDDARRLLALLADQPPGHIPPYLEAQFARGRGLIAAAAGQHDAVEGDLNAAVAALRALGYPYWLAVAQTDLAAWLVDRGRGDEAAPLLDEAIATLRSLGAVPELARAQSVIAVPARAISS